MPTADSDHLRDLGARLRRRREDLGFTLEGAAKAAGVAIATWGDAERGQKRPQGGTLLKMEKTLLFAPGSLRQFLVDGTEPADVQVGSLRDVALNAVQLAAEAPPITQTHRAVEGGEQIDVTYKDPSTRIFALVGEEDSPLTQEERVQLAEIAAAVWRRLHPGADSDS